MIQNGRRYRSRKNPPCDSCRARKSYCRIITSAPCERCKQTNRECTFLAIANRRTDVPNTTGMSRRSSNDNDPLVPRQPPHDLLQHLPQDLSRNISQELPQDLPQELSRQLPQELPDNLSQPLLTDLSPEDLDQHLQDVDFDSLLMPNDLTPGNIFGPATTPTNMATSFVSTTISSVGQPTTVDTRQANSLDNKENHTTQMFGWSNESDPYLLAKIRYDDRDEYRFNMLTFRQISKDYPVYFMMTNNTLPDMLFKKNVTLKDELRAKLDRLVPPDTGKLLIDLYVKHIHPSMPIFSKQALLQNYSTDGNVGLLACIYMLALPFTPYELGVSKTGFGIYQKPSNDELYDVAYQCYNQDLHAPTLSTIMILLLLLQAPPKHQFFADSPYAWNLACSLYSLAQTLGLVVDCINWHIPLHEKCNRRRLWWAVYCTEKWVSLSLGRASSIHDDDWDVTDLTRNDFDDEKEYSESRRFLQLCSLSRILSDTLAGLYSLKSIKQQSNDPGSLSPLAKNLYGRLKSWWEEFPCDLRIESFAPAVITPNGALSMCYLTLAVTIAKVFLRSPQIESINNFRFAIREVAYQLYNFVNQLKSEHTKGFWYSWCREQFAIGSSFLLQVLYTSASTEEALEYKALTDRWQWSLLTQINNFTVASLGSRRLNAMYGAGIEKTFRFEPQIELAFKSQDISE